MRRDKQRIAAKIAARRGQLNLSQRDLARRAGIAPNTAGALERGASISVTNESKIERALGWEHGSVEAIGHGQDPTPLHDPAAPGTPTLKEALAVIDRVREMFGDEAAHELLRKLSATEETPRGQSRSA